MLAQQTAELNLIPGQIPTVINLNQFDILSKGLSFTFYKGSESFDISGLTAVIDGHKPDGNVYEYTGTISDNAAVFDITEQMTVAYGKSVCEVRLKDSDGNNIGTANFILHIEQSPLNVPIESTSSFPDIENIVKNSKAYMEKAQESASSAESSAAAASESAAAAAGSKDAAALSESNAKTSETAAKASEANAAASESSASISEANAKASETNAKTSESNAAASEKNAKASETAAGNSAAAAETSETNAKTSETNSKNYYDEIVKKVDSLSVIDTEMSDTSINAVQNKVIKSYVDSLSVVDTEMSDDSINAVQNKVIKAYVDKVNSDILVAIREQRCINEGIDGIEWDLDDLMTLVRNGEFNKFAIGDSFVDGNIHWRIHGKKTFPKWAFDGTVGETPNTITCLPDEALGTHRYNSSNTNVGGYADSEMPSYLENTILPQLSAGLRSYIKETQIYENNKGNWAAVKRKMRIPTIIECTGNQGFADPFSGGICSQLPLMRATRHRIKTYLYWCLDPVAFNTTDFCGINQNGYSQAINASLSSGSVRSEIVLG